MNIYYVFVYFLQLFVMHTASHVFFVRLGVYAHSSAKLLNK